MAEHEQVIVCAACLSPACAAGELLCEAAVQAGLRFTAAAAERGIPWPPEDAQAQPWPQASLFPGGYPVEFVVYGKPAPQGSKVPGYSGKGPNRRMTHMRESAGHALERWRADIVAQAKITMAGRAPLDGPLRAAVTLSLKYPDRPRKGTPAYEWPEAPAGPPDWDKLMRAVGDALKIGGVIVDDARITGFDRAEKVWAGSGEIDALDRPGVVIRVRRR